MIVFYVLCLLFVLSTASVVCDLLDMVLYLYFANGGNYGVSNNPICNLKNFFKNQFYSILYGMSNTLTSSIQCLFALRLPKSY